VRTWHGNRSESGDRRDITNRRDGGASS
jgi:hypothetical protein